MSDAHITIGIDVGGTFTHGVALEASTGAIVAAATVPTTHSDPDGVARGVVESMRALLGAGRFAADEVLLIAHSTTQATNALLEGDVATVGIIGMGGGVTGRRARTQTKVADITLAPGKNLRTVHRFIDTRAGAGAGAVRRAWDGLAAEGAEVCVVSEAFAVDDDRNEREAAALLAADGVLVTPACSVSRLYGLRVRTRTAVINASMMPLMLRTAAMTERAVRESGIRAPLMVMRSDGGIMDIAEMRRRPILTMLSGPAAGVAAALMVARISDGVFCEVGGTSTDISVVVNGRPSIRSGEVGGHALHVRTLDVRTAGIGGGSMVRLRGRRLAGVGPRSAHIAGLRYPSFAAAEELDGLTADLVAPRTGDAGDHLVLRAPGGAGFALTPTDAANLLGEVKGYGKAAPAAVERLAGAVASLFGEDAAAVARAILRQATVQPAALVRRLFQDYALRPGDVTLVGGGGGAWAIIPALGRALGMSWSVTAHAEIISALGVAMAMIQETVERNAVNPSPRDILDIRHEALESVVRMGADPATVEVRVEVDARRNIVRATARGSPEMRTGRPGRKLAPETVRERAAQALGVEPGDAVLLGRAGVHAVYGHRKKRRFPGRAPLRACVVDTGGIVRLRLRDPSVHGCLLADLPGTVARVLEESTAYGDAGALLPAVFVLVSARIIDLSSLVQRDQVTALLRAETDSIPPGEDAVALVVRRR